ncbi:MAG: AtpZ/AtpI family protein [Gemmatimonadota bacterium]
MPEKPQEPAGRELGLGYKYVSLGLSFAVSITLFVGGGYLLDRWLGLLPLFTVVGALGGSALSFVWVFRKLNADEAADRADRGKR